MKEEMLIEGYKVRVEKTKNGYAAAIDDLNITVEAKKKEEIEAAVIVALNKYFRELYSLPEKKSRLKIFKIRPAHKKKEQRSKYGKKSSPSS